MKLCCIHANARYIFYCLYCHHTFFLSVQSVAHPQCMHFPFFWWNYSAERRDGQECRRNGKIRNDLEAKMAASYCYWLYSEGIDPEHIAILSPYRAQVSIQLSAMLFIITVTMHYVNFHKPDNQVNKIKEELERITDCRLDEFMQSSVFTVDEFQVITDYCPG